MIDWFTVIAQVVNFLILVGLLRYFLYDRIVAAMQAREQAIAAEWDAAADDRAAAAEERSAAEAANRRLADRRGELLAEVRDEVDACRQEMMTKARGEVDTARSRWREAIHEESAAFLRELRRRTCEQVVRVARRALNDLADVDLERQVISNFLRELRELGTAEKEGIANSLAEGRRSVTVQTTAPLSSDLENTIKQTLREEFLEDLAVQFEQADDLMCGVAVQLDAHRLAWNLRDYLDTLERQIQRTLDDEVHVPNLEEHHAHAAGSS